MTRRCTLYLVASSVLVAACGQSNDAPPPAPAASTPPRPLEASTIVLPVAIALATLEAKLEKKIPTVLNDPDKGDSSAGVRFDITRGRIDLAMDGRRLRLTLPIRLKGSKPAPRVRPGGVSGFSCDTSADITLVSEIDVTPDWRLESVTGVEPRTWSRPCKVSPLQIDVIELADKTALQTRLAEVAAKLDSQLAEQTALQDKLAAAWASLHRPTQAGEKTAWMLFSPEALSLTRIHGDVDYLYATVGVRARPRIVLGEEPAAEVAGPLPANEEVASDETFHVALEAVLPFEEATALLSERLTAEPLTVDGNTVTIEKARVFGNGDAFVLEVGFSDPVTATIYLSGVPRYDEAAEELRVDGLDFTVESGNVLAKLADWMLHGQVQEAIAEKAVFSMGDKIDMANGRLQSGLNREVRPGVTLQSDVTGLAGRDVYVTATDFRAVVVATGRATLDVGEAGADSDE